MGVETYRAHDFLEAARGLDLEVHVVLDAPHAFGEGSDLSWVDFGRLEEGAGRIGLLHGAAPFSAVLAVDDHALELAAVASRRLGLPGNAPESVHAAMGKGVFRSVLEAAGAPGPWHRLVSIHADAAALWEELGVSCVLKPTFLNASQGVIRADDRAGFVAAFERLRGLLGREEIARRGGEAAHWLLVEEYLPGAEAALEGLVIGGRFHLLAFLDKPEPLEGPYFQETLFITPSRHLPAVQEQALQAVQQAVSALGLRTGPVHAEVRLQGLRPGLAEGATRAVVLELALRSIGGRCAQSLRFAGGLSLEALILAQALEGEEFVPPRRERQASGVMMLPIPRAGILRGVRHQEAARAQPGITSLVLELRPGEVLSPPPEGARYLGFLFAQGDTPQEVEHALRQAHAKLELEIE